MPQSKEGILHNSVLFADMTPSEIERLCTLLCAFERHYQRGRHLISAGDPISGFGLLLAGAIQVFMDDVDGNHIVMADVSPGSLFAEAMACTGIKESPSLLWPQQTPLCSGFHCALRDGAFLPIPLCARFGVNLLRAVSERSLRFNDRIQVLSKKSIREKTDHLFSQQVQQQKSLQITLNMDRSTMADYLGVERTALSGIVPYAAGQHSFVPQKPFSSAPWQGILNQLRRAHRICATPFLFFVA